MEGSDNGDKGKSGLLTFEEKAIADAAATMRELTESGLDSTSIEAKLGVLQRAITAVAKDDEYRQILLLAAFDNKQEAMLASDAITERKRYGVDIQPILDRLIAQCAVHADRLNRVLSAMTNYSMNINDHNKLPSWKRKQEDRSLT